MALQGIKATLLPNEADYVIVDKEIALRWSTKDTDESWESDDYLWELLEEQHGLDPWGGCNDGVWTGWSWVEDDPNDGSDYDNWDDYNDQLVEYLPDWYDETFDDDLF